MIPQYQGYQSEKIRPLVQNKLQQNDINKIYNNLEKDFIRIPKYITSSSEYKDNFNFEKTKILKNYVDTLENKHQKTIIHKDKQIPRQRIEKVKFEPLIKENPFHQIFNRQNKKNENKENEQSNQDQKQNENVNKNFETNYKSTFLKSAEMMFENPSKYQSQLIKQNKISYDPTEKQNRKNYRKGFQSYGKDFHNTVLLNVKELIDDPNAELLKGTTKISQHIPGYQGYIPENNQNEKIRKILTGDIRKQIYTKQSVLDNYSKHIPGYTGYQSKFVK